MSTIIIPEPHYQSKFELAEYELFRMEANCRRMKYMIQNGYYVSEYTDEHWDKFKKILNQNKDE